MMLIVEGKSNNVGDRVGTGVAFGTHPVWPALTLLPSGQQVHFVALGPEYCPGGHFLHIFSGEGE